MLAAAGEPATSSSDAEQPREQRPGSGASWSSGAEPRAQPPAAKRRPDAAAAPRATIAHHVKFEALQALSGALAQQLQAKVCCAQHTIVSENTANAPECTARL